MKMKKLLALAMVACLSVASYSVGFAHNSDTNDRRPLSKESEQYYASLEAQKTANGTGVATIADADREQRYRYRRLLRRYDHWSPDRNR